MGGEKVLDSWALLCYLEQEHGYEKVIDLFDRAISSSKPLLMCTVNWGEVYYQVARRLGNGRAREIERLIDSFPIKLVDADKNLTREAARFKSSKRLAYGDCFAAALTKQKKAELYTGDREFELVEDEIKVIWL